MDADAPEWWNRGGSLCVIGLGVSGTTYKSGYDRTPRRAKTFGGTGGDGIHYSFLPITNRRLEDCPVIVTEPVFSNSFVGANLFDFLCAGSRCGFTFLCDIDEEGFLDPNNHRKSIYVCPFKPETKGFRIQKLFNERFNLKLWDEPAEHYRWLCEQFGPLLGES